MKKFAALLLTLLMAVSLMACAGNKETAETSPVDAENSISEEASEQENSTDEPISEEMPEQESNTDVFVPEETENETEEESSDVLVAYFSATNTTEGVAEVISDATGADLYEIVPEDPYTDADLDYSNDNSRSTIEMNDPSARPAISGSVENMERYRVVFLGYPIWWGEAPRIVSTFVESYDFSGKTVVPFCTSGGSGIGSSAANLEQLTSGGEWLEGTRLSGDSSHAEIVEWVNSFGLAEVSAE